MSGAQYTARYKHRYVSKDGKKKARWCTLGVASEGNTGTIVLFLDTLPLPQHDWDGTVMLFPVKTKEGDG